MSTDRRAMSTQSLIRKRYRSSVATRGQLTWAAISGCGVPWGNKGPMKLDNTAADATPTVETCTTAARGIGKPATPTPVPRL